MPLFLTSDRPQKLVINGPQTRPDCQKARHLVELACLGVIFKAVTEMVIDIILGPRKFGPRMKIIEAFSYWDQISW